METTHHDAPMYRLLLGEPRPARRALVDGVRAMVHRGRLDSELASGKPVHGVPLRAMRARQLTTRRSREGLAAAVEKLVDASERPPRSGRSSRAPVRWSEVSSARASLLGVAGVLRSPGPVSARGVAMVRALLIDGSSPIYSPFQAPDELWHATRDAMRALEDPTQT